MTKHSRLGLTLLALAGTTALACSELNAPLYFRATPSSRRATTSRFRPAA